MREHARRVSGGDVYWTISTLPVVLANHTFMAHAHTPCLAFCMVWWGVLWHMLTGSSHLHHLLPFVPYAAPSFFFDVAQITHESIWQISSETLFCALQFCIQMKVEADFKPHWWHTRRAPCWHMLTAPP